MRVAACLVPIGRLAHHRVQQRPQLLHALTECRALLGHVLAPLPRVWPDGHRIHLQLEPFDVAVDDRDARADGLELGGAQRGCRFAQLALETHDLGMRRAKVIAQGQEAIACRLVCLALRSGARCRKICILLDGFGFRHDFGILRHASGGSTGKRAWRVKRASELGGVQLVCLATGRPASRSSGRHVAPSGSWPMADVVADGRCCRQR
eukprot:371365-Prymnesium_polylepis.3